MSLIEELKKYETDDPETRELIEKLLDKLTKWYHCKLFVKVHADVSVPPVVDTIGTQTVRIEEQKIDAVFPIVMHTFVQAADEQEAKEKCLAFEKHTLSDYFEFEFDEYEVRIPESITRLQVISVDVEEVVAAEMTADNDNHCLVAKCPICGELARVTAHRTTACSHYVGSNPDEEPFALFFRKETSSQEENFLDELNRINVFAVSPSEGGTK